MTATPFLHVDIDQVQRNIDGMADWSRRSGIVLRPHAKTHKSIELARLQIAAGAVGITVATVGEAEVFAAAGFSDIFIGYPLWVDDALATRLRSVAAKARLVLGIDSVESFQQAHPLLGQGVSWRIELDSGHHRSGAPAHAIAELANTVLDSGASLDGVFTFPGHSYSPATRQSAAYDEAASLGAAAATLRALGVDQPTLSGGSTPSMGFIDTNTLTEARPGVYLFGDAQQWELGTIEPERIALWALGTVVSRSPGRFVTNVGSKILGADRASYSTGYGRLLDAPEDRIVLLSEHHSVVETSGPLPQLGSEVRIVPNHVCNAVNLVDALYEQSGRAIAVDARGRSS